jgi:hypothetical protein
MKEFQMINLDAITKDPDLLKKLLIGSLISITGIGLIPLLGWMVSASQRTIEDENAFLPDWTDFGKLITDGLKMLGLTFIWSLPAILLITGVSVSGVFLEDQFASQDEFAVFFVFLTFCAVGLTFLLLIPIGMLSAVAPGLLAEEGFSAALNPARGFRVLRQNLGGFLIAVLISMLASSILSTVGTMLCLIGVFPATVLTYGFTGQLFGRAYRDAVANQGYSA